MFTKLLSTTVKANLETQFQALTTLTNIAFQGGTKIIDLNMGLAKARLEESSVVLNQFLSVKDPHEYFSLVANQTQESIEKTLSHCRDVADITNSTRAEFAKIVNAKVAHATAKQNAV